MDISPDALETGEKYLFKIPQLDFQAELPYVLLPTQGGCLKIASLNLVGMIGWNDLFAGAIATAVRERLGDLTGVVFMTAVEKSLQLGQAVCQRLGVPMMAVAYNRRKPHMEIEAGRKRPFIQVGGGSITSGDKYMVIYERDYNLIAAAKNGVVIIDDVVSTGGTLAALATVLDDVAERRGIDKDSLRIRGIFCVAREGQMKPLYRGLSERVFCLGTLPAPQFIPE